MALRQTLRAGASTRASATSRARGAPVVSASLGARVASRVVASPLSLSPLSSSPRRAAAAALPAAAARPAAPSRRPAAPVRAQAAAATPFKWGADMKSLSVCVGVACLLWVVPPPAGVTLKAWHLLSLFVGTILGIITTPLPLGAVAMLGLGATMLTKTLTFAQAFSAFASEIP